jgi:hypothetical protein
MPEIERPAAIQPAEECEQKSNIPPPPQRRKVMKRMILRPIKKSPAENEPETDPSKSEEKTVKRRKDYSWLTGKEREKWKEDFHKKAEMAAEFAKRMREAQKNIKQHEEEQHRKLFARVEKEIDAKAIHVAVTLQEERRQKMIEARFARFEEKRKERMELLKFASALPPRKFDVAPRIDRGQPKLKSKTKSGIEMPELEKAKQVLAEKRNVHGGAASLDPEERERRFQEILKKYRHDEPVDLTSSVNTTTGKDAAKMKPFVFNVKAVPATEEPSSGSHYEDADNRRQQPFAEDGGKEYEEDDVVDNKEEVEATPAEDDL